MGEPRPIEPIPEPRITWTAADEGKLFSRPKIKEIKREVCELLPEIPETIDNPCAPRKFADVQFDEKFIWAKNLIPLLIDSIEEDDPTKNIFGEKYFNRVTPLLAPSASGDVQLEVSLFKTIDGVEFTCHFKIECDEINFQITKVIDNQKVNFNSNYKIVRPAYLKGGAIQPGKAIFRPYADPTKYSGRLPRKVSFTRVPKVPVVNYLKDLKELLPLQEDKDLVKIDAPYELIELLLNKLRIREGTKDYEKFSRAFFGMQTEEHFCKHVNSLKDRYREYLNSGIKEKKPDTGEDIILPIEELTTFDKIVELGNDYIHPNQVRDIKRLAILDKRFELINITEVQQKLIDDDGSKSRDIVKKTRVNGYPKLIVNVEVPRYWPVNYGFFTPFTFTDLLTTRVGEDYFRNAIGITPANYRSWFEKMEEFKSKCLTFASLYHMLILTASKYIFITPETRTIRGKSITHGNSKKDAPINLVKFNLPKFYPGKDYFAGTDVNRMVCFFSHFAQENPTARDREIKIVQKILASDVLTASELKDPIPGTTDITNLIEKDLVYLQVVEGNLDTELERSIVTGDAENANRIASKLLGETIENISEGETYEYNEEDFETTLFDPVLMDEILCKRLEKQEARRAAGMKTFAELAAALEGTGFGKAEATSLFNFEVRKRKIKEDDDDEEDEDFDYDIQIISGKDRGSGSGSSVDKKGNCKKVEPNDAGRRKKLVKDLIEGPLRCHRMEQSDIIWRRMDKRLKVPIPGVTRTDKIKAFAIGENKIKLKAAGVKEEDLDFQSAYLWNILMGYDYINKVLREYLILLQKGYNESFNREGELVESKPDDQGTDKPTPYSTFKKVTLGGDTYDEKEICERLFDGEKYNKDEDRVEGIKQALKFIEEFGISPYAREAIIAFIKPKTLGNQCTDPDYTNYIKVTFGVDDEEVPPCQGGERIRLRQGKTDILDATVDIETFTSDQLNDVGINPKIPPGQEDTYELDAGQYKTKMRALLTQVKGAVKKLGKYAESIQEKKERQAGTAKAAARGTAAVKWDDDYINSMFEVLRRNKLLSMADFIEERDLVKPAPTEVDPLADKTDLLAYDVGRHEDDKLEKVIIIRPAADTAYEKKIKKILEKTSFGMRKIDSDARANEFTKEILRNMKNRVTYGQALRILGETVESSKEKISAIEKIKTRLRSGPGKGKPTKIVETAADEIYKRNLAGKPISDKQGIDFAMGKIELPALGGGSNEYNKYIKYKAKYLSLVSKLRKLGINI